MESIIKRRNIIKFTNGKTINVEDSVVTEFPVTIKVNEKEFLTMVCTPQYIEDMVIGYLASERVIQSYKDIKNLWIQEKEGFVHVEIENLPTYYETFQNKRYITSCCGGSRQGFVFTTDALAAKKINSHHVSVTPEECIHFMNKLQNSADTFKYTGGVHNAALYNQNGFSLERMDIGRHNALDKIYGYCLKNNIDLHGKVVAFSGRISSEILLKANKIGCEILLSKSAPTELALELAEELGMTTVGFIRGEGFNVYTGSERIIFPS